MLKTKQLKGLKIQSQKIIDHIKKLKNDQSLIAKELRAKCAQLNEVNQAIKILQQKEIFISEHAILRYLERVCHINLKEIRSRILNPRTRYLIETLGDGSYPLVEAAPEPVCIKVKGNVVTTVCYQDDKQAKAQ